MSECLRVAEAARVSVIFLVSLRRLSSDHRFELSVPTLLLTNILTVHIPTLSPYLYIIIFKLGWWLFHFFYQNTKSIRIIQTLRGFHIILASLTLSEYLKVFQTFSKFPSLSKSPRVSESVQETLQVLQSDKDLPECPIVLHGLTVSLSVYQSLSESLKVY